jgi:hypothetical protein
MTECTTSLVLLSPRIVSGGQKLESVPRSFVGIESDREEVDVLACRRAEKPLNRLSCSYFEII